MHDKEKIDTIAYLGKSIVDMLPIEKMEKEKRKLDIDALAFLLKQCVMSSPLEIQQIQAAAQFYHLERVVAFPCMVNGENRTFFKMYGGSIAAFCEHLGIQQLSENDVQLNPIYISQMEQKYGVVLYEQIR